LFPIIHTPYFLQIALFCISVAMFSHLLLLLISTLSLLANATCMGHLHRRATSNNTVEISKFGYSGAIGPLLWQTLATENAICEKGENQSPINIG
jgi:carbonic anhydrase